MLALGFHYISVSEKRNSDNLNQNIIVPLSVFHSKATLNKLFIGAFMDGKYLVGMKGVIFFCQILFYSDC